MDNAASRAERPPPKVVHHPELVHLGCQVAVPLIIQFGIQGIQGVQLFLLRLIELLKMLLPEQAREHPLAEWDEQHDRDREQDAGQAGPRQTC